MILAYVTMGIANLKNGAGRLLLITVILAYVSTLLAGSASYLVAHNLFPSFMSADALEQIAATAGNSLETYFSLSIPPLFDTLSAVVLAFVLGLCLSTLRGKTIGDTLYNAMTDFSGIIDQVLPLGDHPPAAPVYLRHLHQHDQVRPDLRHPQHPVEGLSGGHPHAPDLHRHPVPGGRDRQPEKSLPA